MNSSSPRNPEQIFKIYVLHSAFSKVCLKENLNTSYRVEEGKTLIIPRAGEAMILRSITKRQINRINERGHEQVTHLKTKTKPSDKHMKRRTSLIIRKMQIETTMRKQYLTISLAEGKKK